VVPSCNKRRQQVIREHASRRRAPEARGGEWEHVVSAFSAPARAGGNGQGKIWLRALPGREDIPLLGLILGGRERMLARFPEKTKHHESSS